jgi:hypothetical protein
MLVVYLVHGHCALLASIKQFVFRIVSMLACTYVVTSNLALQGLGPLRAMVVEHRNERKEKKEKTVLQVFSEVSLFHVYSDSASVPNRPVVRSSTRATRAPRVATHRPAS